MRGAELTWSNLAEGLPQKPGLKLPLSLHFCTAVFSGSDKPAPALDACVATGCIGQQVPDAEAAAPFAGIYKFFRQAGNHGNQELPARGPVRFYIHDDRPGSGAHHEMLPFVAFDLLGVRRKNAHCKQS